MQSKDTLIFKVDSLPYCKTHLQSRANLLCDFVGCPDTIHSPYYCLDCTDLLHLHQPKKATSIGLKLYAQWQEIFSKIDKLFEHGTQRYSKYEKLIIEFELKILEIPNAEYRSIE